MKKTLTGLILALFATVAFAGDRPNVPTPYIPPFPPSSGEVVITTALTSFVFLPTEVNVNRGDATVQVVATVMSASKFPPKSVTVYVEDGGFNNIYGVQLRQSRGPRSQYNAWTGTMVIPQSANPEVQTTTSAPIRVLVVDWANNGKMYTSWDLQELGYINELLIRNYELMVHQGTN